MKNRTVPLFLLLSAISFLLSYSFLPAQADKEKMDRMTLLYKQAMESFQKKEYPKAIKFWENVLEIDARQKIPKKMIEQARTMMKSSIAPLMKEASDLYQKGLYKQALEEYQYLLSLDSTNSRIKNLKEKMEIITKYFSDVSGKDRTSVLTRKGLNEYADSSGDVRNVMITFLYLSQLLPSDKPVTDFLEMLKMNFPDIFSEEKPVPGINLLEQKLNTARYSIEDAKYDLAIRSCNNALFLDENNVTAMARMGTAYYLLGKLDQAKTIWKKAIALDPKHESSKTIKQFLDKIK